MIGKTIREVSFRSRFSASLREKSLDFEKNIVLKGNDVPIFETIGVFFVLKIVFSF